MLFQMHSPGQDEPALPCVTVARPHLDPALVPKPEDHEEDPLVPEMGRELAWREHKLLAGYSSAGPDGKASINRSSDQIKLPRHGLC